MGVIFSIKYAVPSSICPRVILSRLWTFRFCSFSVIIKWPPTRKYLRTIGNNLSIALSAGKFTSHTYIDNRSEITKYESYTYNKIEFWTESRELFMQLRVFKS